MMGEIASFPIHPAGQKRRINLLVYSIKNMMYNYRTNEDRIQDYDLFMYCRKNKMKDLCIRQRIVALSKRKKGLHLEI